MLRYLWLTLLVVVFAGRADAAIRPSFRAKHSANTSTHVVVAAQSGEHLSQLSVLHSWRGGLEPGMTIKVPELAQLPEAPWQGKNLVLFLIKSSATATARDDSKPDSYQPRWLPAGGYPYSGGGVAPSNYYDVTHFNIAIAWVEEDRVYALQQTFNPGPLNVTRLSKSLDDLKQLVGDRSTGANELSTALRISEPAERARALAPWTEHREHRQREKAFMALAACGVVAVPHRREILANDELSDRHYLTVTAMALAGGNSVGEELTKMLRDELAFWKTQVPSIKAESWNELPGHLRLRHGKLSQILWALDWMRYPDAKDLVVSVRANWLKSRMHHRVSVGEILSCCDAYLKHHAEEKGRDR